MPEGKLTLHHNRLNETGRQIAREAWLANVGHLSEQTIGFVIQDWKEDKLALRVTESAFSEAYRKYHKGEEVIDK